MIVGAEEVEETEATRRGDRTGECEGDLDEYAEVGTGDDLADSNVSNTDEEGV